MGIKPEITNILEVLGLSLPRGAKSSAPFILKGHSSHGIRFGYDPKSTGNHTLAFPTGKANNLSLSDSKLKKTLNSHHLMLV